ncbi:Cytochrome P450 monooxygenase CYP63 [Mycena indigotica]|uniref:Cytochrome P450 monooxygenase CYP63 n=1 Tax=Mycena indigotica TaxID=2126181 RepID=A0A8H6SYF6_9AGAR|nr:Cytochrome P450 monooxygenase CYP63 [Mycena indigotica]KAF7306220.1 Cytochrome P450 monooxygenase CYP63 [Mycena indigotica]
MTPRTRPPTAFERGIPDYRQRILLSLTRAILLPPLIALTLSYSLLRSPTMATSVITAVFSIPACIALRYSVRTRRQRNAARALGATMIPRVRGKWPGNVDVVLRVVKSFQEEYVLQVFADLFDEYQTNTLNTGFFWDDQIVTRDENVMKYISSTGFASFEKGILWHERIDKLLGTGLFNAEGELWRKGRATARPFFAKERISDFNTFERTVSTTLDLLAHRSAVNLPIDVQDLLERFTLDSASEFLFGMQLDTLSQPLTEPGRVKLGPRGSMPIEGATAFDEFTQAFENVAVIITRRGTQGDTWPLLELFADKTEDATNTIMNWLEPIVKRAIDEKDQRRLAGVATPASENVFLDYLASRTDDVEHIRYELVTYLIASRDTTASLLTFVMYFFAMYPDVCSRLRQEVLAVIGPINSPSYETLRSMKYLRAVLNEALRLLPSAPLIARTSLDKPQIIPVPNGPSWFFPPKTQAMMISLLTHRRADLWGPDANEFRPARWLEPETVAKVNATPFMYCPFSGGPRICIGQEFALNEAGFFLVRLLQRFKRFALAPEFQPAGSLPPDSWKGRPGRQTVERIFPAINFTLHSRGGMWMRAEADLEKE